MEEGFKAVDNEERKNERVNEKKNGEKEINREG